MYRKLGRDTQVRRSILSGITRDVITNGYCLTTNARAKECAKFVNKMITYGKSGTLISRRKALAFFYNDAKVVDIIFNDLAKRFENRDGGYTRIIKVKERIGDDALMVRLELVD